jgi:hypothetical protein
MRPDGLGAKSDPPACNEVASVGQRSGYRSSSTDSIPNDAIRVRTSSPLGFGERIVEIPISALTVLHGTVVLDLTPEQVDQFPDADSADDSTRSTD